MPNDEMEDKDKTEELEEEELATAVEDDDDEVEDERTMGQRLYDFLQAKALTVIDWKQLDEAIQAKWDTVAEELDVEEMIGTVDGL